MPCQINQGHRIPRVRQDLVEINQAIPRVRQILVSSNFTLPLLSPPSLVASHERPKGSTHLYQAHRCPLSGRRLEYRMAG
jgi:hypothetical protein